LDLSYDRLDTVVLQDTKRHSRHDIHIYNSFTDIYVSCQVNEINGLIKWIESMHFKNRNCKLKWWGSAKKNLISILLYVQLSLPS